MGAEHVLPFRDQSIDQILDEIKERRRARGSPLLTYTFDVSLPLLHHSDESPLSCREDVEELEAVTSHFSTQIHNLFNALVACQSLDAKAVGELSPYLHSDGIFLKVNVELQSFDRPLSCHHRTYHSNRLILKDLDALPQVPGVTKLRLLSAPDYGALVGFANVRPISPRVPLELLMRLPAIQKLECPWIWERMPIALPGEPMRHYTRPQSWQQSSQSSRGELID